MADIFLSYSSQDRVVAGHIEQALAAAGYDVFWDQETPTGRDWNSWIGEKLRSSRVVIVLWSKASVISRNVVHEATISVEKGTLIPAMVETLGSGDYPMGFYTVQGADLRGFSGGDHPGMAKLLAAVKERLGQGAEGPRVAPPPPPPEKRGAPLALIAAGVVAVLGMGGVIGLVALNRPSPITAETTPAPPDLAASQAATLPGDYHWSGLACGQGPHLALNEDGSGIVVTMTGAPTYEHAIEKTDGEVTHTIVVEPESDRGQQYELKTMSTGLSVKNVTSGQLDEWEKCP